MSSEKVISKIKEILVPRLGEFVTDSAIRVNCQRLGVKPESLTFDKIPDFVKKIKVTLILFFEEKEVEQIIQRIKNIKQ